MSLNDTLKQEIAEYVASQGRHYYNWDIEKFFSDLENEGDIVLPSGTAEYVDVVHEVGDGESLAIFSVNGANYAFKGTYTSWGSEWDSGPFEVEKRTVTIERWETL